jgi:hypothetical protein
LPRAYDPFRAGLLKNECTSGLYTSIGTCSTNDNTTGIAEDNLYSTAVNCKASIGGQPTCAAIESCVRNATSYTFNDTDTSDGILDVGTVGNNGFSENELICYNNPGTTDVWVASWINQSSCVENVFLDSTNPWGALGLADCIRAGVTSTTKVQAAVCPRPGDDRLTIFCYNSSNVNMGGLGHGYPWHCVDSGGGTNFTAAVKDGVCKKASIASPPFTNLIRYYSDDID